MPRPELNLPAEQKMTKLNKCAAPTQCQRAKLNNYKNKTELNNTPADMR